MEQKKVAEKTKVIVKEPKCQMINLTKIMSLIHTKVLTHSKRKVKLIKLNFRNGFSITIKSDKFTNLPACSMEPKETIKSH